MLETFDDMTAGDPPRAGRAIVMFVLGALLILTGIGLLFGQCIYTETRYTSIVRRMTNAISPSDLQAWAVKVIATNKPGEFNPQPLDTDTLPDSWRKTLISAWRKPPRFVVYDPQSDNPGCIRITWGGGGIGYTGFEVGPTNFQSMIGNEIAHGVYWFRTR